MAGDNSKTPLVEKMIRLEQHRNDIGVEQEKAHFGGVGDWRRISRMSFQNASTSSGWPRSL